MSEHIVKAPHVPPFVTFVTSAVPMVFDNSLSYYEALCALWKWLQDDVVNVINNNATVTEDYIDLTNEYTQKFIELKEYVDTYFDNLDVQEEINNKLDAMAEDGTLQELINAYLQPNIQWTFDTVADMKSSTNLVDGSYAKTLGFHSVNDGGAGLYKISNTGTADEMSVIAVGDLYATLIYGESVTPEMFGAYGDGTTNDQDYINAALQSSATVLNFCKGKTYAIKGYEDGQAQGGTNGLYETTGIVVPSNRVINLNECTIQIIANNRQNYNGFTLAQVHDVVIENGNIIGDVGTHTGNTGEFGYGVAIKTSSNITLRNLYCAKHWGDGINLHVHATAVPEYQNKNILIENCICDDNRRQGMSVLTGNNVIVKDCKFINTARTAYTAPGAGVDVEPGISWVYNITFDSCEFYNNYGAGFISDASNENVDGLVLDNCYIHDNTCYGTQTECFIDDTKNAVVRNSHFKHGNSTYRSLTFRPYGNIVFENNLVEDFRIAVGCHYNSSEFFISNNEIRIATALPNDAVLLFTGNYPNNKGTLYVSNNKFLNVSDDKSLNIQSWIDGSPTAGIGTIVVKNNVFKGGKTGIQVVTPAIIHNNRFIASYQSAISVRDTAQSNTITDVQNNIFEQSCFTAVFAGVIWTKASFGYVIRNNVFYKATLNPADSVTTVSYPGRWCQTVNTGGVNIEEYNHIVDNS